MRRVLGLLLLLMIAGSTPSNAETSWDLIYTDRLDVTLCYNECGIFTSGKDFALLVNTGNTGISSEEITAATFTIRSSRPEIRMLMFPLQEFFSISPIMPGEAVGTVAEADEVGGSNDILLSKVHPGETYRNTAPLAVLSIGVQRTDFNTYSGPVHFDIEMVLGGSIAKFAIDVNVRLGDFRIDFPSAARVSAVLETTPVAHATWGQLRARYR